MKRSPNTSGGTKADAKLHEELLANVPDAVKAYKGFRKSMPDAAPSDLAEFTGITTEQARQAEKELAQE